MKSYIALVAALLLLVGSAAGQSLTQTVRGKLYDIETQSPIPGGNIAISGSSLGTASNAEGTFRIANVPVGRHDLTASFIGYEPVTLPNILVTSAKEVVLNIGLKQASRQMDEVVVKANQRKDRTVNTMASISSRTFSVEETRRYAGGLDDPARMASAFAGVTVGNIQDNAIIIRGNSPKGVSWRVEGVEIPNPNHFAGGNVAGGGFVSILSSQLLSNSDFYTGAFPAEYGNALAGVFDMRMRVGNNEKREHTAQIGLMGIDVASEGPFKKGKSSSYLFNYRYATSGILSKLKIIPTDQVPIYQDLSFKMNFPTAKAGTFSVWGIGGIDNVKEPEDADSTKWKVDFDRVKFDWNIKTGAAGVTHKLTLGRSLLSTSVAASGTSNIADQTRFDDLLQMRPNAYIKNNTATITVSSFINSKLSANHTLRAGATFKQLRYNLDISSTINEVPDTYQNMVKEKGSSQVMEAYWQSRYQLSPAIQINGGINASYFALNKNYSVDPRFSIKWQMADRHALTLGVGKHSQLEELRFYFVKQQNSASGYPNKKLDYSQAQHLILGYDWNVSSNLRLKVEAYYQKLYRIPGIADSSYSMVNFKQDWSFYSTLINNTKGKNMGIDITLERFLSNGFYYLATASLFDSKYKGGDKVWHNTRFDKGYSLNFLAGKEYAISRNRIVGINGRVNYLGGERKTPILNAESLAAKRVIFDESRAFEEQYPATCYVDFTLTYRTNKKRYAGTWALQIKNLLNAPIYSGPAYNYRDRKIEEQKVGLVLPVISYRVDF